MSYALYGWGTMAADGGDYPPLAGIRETLAVEASAQNTRCSLRWLFALAVAALSLAGGRSTAPATTTDLSTVPGT